MNLKARLTLLWTAASKLILVLLTVLGVVIF